MTSPFPGQQILAHPIQEDLFTEVSESGYVRSEARMREVAAQRGCVIVRPKKNEIQLDIDDELSLNCFEARWSRIATNFNFTGQVSRKPSPSGRPGRWHITVTLSRNVSEHERILLQACLGSDPVRELLNLVHLQKGEISTLFFEKAVTEGSEDPPHETFYEELAKE